MNNIPDLHTDAYLLVTQTSTPEASSVTAYNNANYGNQLLDVYESEEEINTVVEEIVDEVASSRESHKKG